MIATLLLLTMTFKTHEEAVFKNELMKRSNIIGVAPKNGGQWGTTAKVSSDSTINSDYETVDESYLPLLKIPLVAGKKFFSGLSIRFY